MTKKSFKRSEPTLAFLSGATAEAKAPKKPQAKRTAPGATAKSEAPKGYKLDPQYIETKSRRVQALVQPSVYEALKAKASSLGISTNEALNEALRQYTEA
jgi:hypothetical protein